MLRERPRRRVAAVAATAVLALVACSDDDGGGSAGSTTPTTVADAESTTAAGSDVSTTAAVESSEATQTSAVETGAVETTVATGPCPTTQGAPGEGEIVVGAVLEPTNLDLVTQAGAALDQILLDNVYETLLTATDDGQVEAGLTELPEISDDGLTYTFAIPEGVTFHTGEPLTAADVVWSLDAQRAEGANQSARLASVESVEAPDDQTVVVTLTEPDNDLLYTLTRRAGAVLQADATQLQQCANGTGPFRFEERNVGASITLVRNDAYHGEAPTIGGVTFLYFTDPNAAVNAFTTGDVDILTGVRPELVGPLQDNPDYVVNEGSTNGEFTLGFNNTREPFTDAAVRKAIRQSIDKDGLLELFEGFGTIIGGPVPPSDPWYEDLTDVAPYDPETAGGVLDQAGVSGTSLTLVYPNIYPTYAAEYIASQLGEVGVDVTIETIEFPVWLERVFTNKDYDMTVVLHVEPRDIGNYANPEYYWNYDSPEVQQLIGDAKVALDPEESDELLRQAARLISEESPVDWLLLGADITVSTPEVTGYPQNDTASRFDASAITIGS